MPEISSGDCAGLVNVTTFVLVAPTATEPKSRLEAERLTAPLVPQALRWTVCGLPAAPSVITSVPVCMPAVVGAKVTLTVHSVPGETDCPHWLVSAKGPVTEIPDMLRAALPALPTFREEDALVVLISWPGKTIGLGTAVRPAAFWGLILAIQAS